MRALVTGAGGFVGHTLAINLLRHGHEVRGVDSFTDYYDSRLKHLNADRAIHAGMDMIVGDILKMNLREILADVDVVFHQAGQPGVRKSWGSDFQTYVDANIRVTQALLEACVDLKSIDRFIYASSSSVYGDADVYPTTEKTLPRPHSPYGVTKLAAEHLCTLYARNFAVPTVSLRYFTVYGPAQRPDMAFTRFIRAALDGTDIPVFGTGEQVRDFTFVDDIVQANVAAAERAVEPGTVLNVSGGSSVSVNEVLATIAELTGKDLSISYLESVKGDVYRTGGSAEEATRLLGWRPLVPLRDGIAAQVEWASQSEW